MKLRLSFGIFPKLLLTMLVVTLIPLGAIWYLDYRAESESLSRQTEQRLSSQADTMAATCTRGWT
jgi:methyl-accepting chemotaxis protein